MFMKKALLLFLSLLYGGWGYSQSLSLEVIATAGDHVSGSTAQMSWTLGEPVSETFAGSGSTILTQGFHQTNLLITGVEDAAVDFRVSVYPNPTAEWLTVDAPEAPAAFGLELFDAMGRPLRSFPIEQQSGKRTVDLTGFTPGMYLLRLRTEDRKTIKTFKIFKIK